MVTGLWWLILTLDGVGLPRVSDSVGEEKSVLSVQNIPHHLLHGAVVEVLLACLWPRNLHTRNTETEMMLKLA